MSFIVSAANGLFTNASTWRLCDAAGSRWGNVTTAQALAAANTNSTAFTANTNTQVDGVALRINLRSTGTPLNTLRVWLRCHTNTTDVAWCNVAVSEIPYSTSALQNGGWMFFKFGAPVTLATGNSYSIVANLSNTQTSVSLQSANSTGAAISQLLRSTTAQAPVPGDDIFIVGEWDGSTDPATPISRLVTMNETTANDYGSNVNESGNREALSISKNAFLRWGGPNAGDPPAANTNYYLKLSGALTVFSGGQLDCGTLGNEIPRGSSAVIEFDTAASKQYGFSKRAGSIANFRGLSRSSSSNDYVCFLSANVSIGDTVIPVDRATGWLAGDEIVIATTSRTYSESDFRSLTANANATHLTVNAALTYAHLGTAPYYCEIINTTRNIVLRAANTASVGYFTTYTDGNTVVDWVQFDAVPITLYYDSYVTNTDFTHCSFRTPGIAATMWAFTSSSIDNFSVKDSVFYGYNFNSPFLSIPSLSNKINWQTTDLYAVGTQGTAFAFAEGTGLIGNLYAAGCGSGSTASISLADTTAWVTQQGNTANLYAHSGGTGVNFNQGPRFGGHHRIVAWRNVNGVSWGPSQIYQMFINRRLTIFAWGNQNYNLGISGCFVNCAVNGSIAGETAFATTDGIKRSSPGTSYFSRAEISFEGMTFGAANGANTTHANNDVNWTSAGYETATLYFKNCLFGSNNQIGGFTTSGYGSSYHISRYDQTSGGAHRSFFNNRGYVTCNTAVYRTAAPSEELSPTIVSPETTLESGVKRVALAANGTANVTVYVRKDVLYNGTSPRLVQKANPAIGLYADTTLATANIANIDTWYAVTGTTNPTIDDGIAEFVIACDGTVGSIFIDDWSVS